MLFGINPNAAEPLRRYPGVTGSCSCIQDSDFRCRNMIYQLWFCNQRARDFCDLATSFQFHLRDSVRILDSIFFETDDRGDAKVTIVMALIEPT